LASVQTRAPITSIMNILTKITATFCLFLIGITQANASSTIFTKAEFEQVKQQYQDQQWLMLLWSVDCPPCFKELAIIGKLSQKSDKLNFILINTDADEESSAERQAVIQQFKLQNVANFHFADGQADQSRYLIDPHWYGELPRSYFIQNNGTFNGKSGLVSESLLRQWLGI